MIGNHTELSLAKVKLVDYRQHWNLQEDGDALYTNSSLLQPVIYEGISAMLKIPIVDEERRALLLLIHWAGNGAVSVLKHSEDAVLMERATGVRSLTEMVLTGGDDEVNRIICSVAAKLHGVATGPTLSLIPLSVWFKSLFFSATQLGGVFSQCAIIAKMLLAQPVDEVVLHGDIHHGNILDGGEKGWLAIDPKALYGERAFDFANIFCNPTLAVAIQDGRLSKQLTVVSTAAGLDPKRLLQWVIAWSGLSAAWMLEEGTQIDEKLKLIEIAFAELARYD